MRSRTASQSEAWQCAILGAIAEDDKSAVRGSTDTRGSSGSGRFEIDSMGHEWNSMFCTRRQRAPIIGDASCVVKIGIRLIGVVRGWVSVPAHQVFIGTCLTSVTNDFLYIECWLRASARVARSVNGGCQQRHCVQS